MYTLRSEIVATCTVNVVCKGCSVAYLYAGRVRREGKEKNGNNPSGVASRNDAAVRRR